MAEDNPDPKTAEELWILTHGVESDSRSLGDIRDSMWESDKFPFPKCRVKLFHYGNFKFWRVLGEEERRVYSQLMKHYLSHQISYYPNVDRVNIVCHSYGTYLFTRALQEAPSERLKANNIVLLGSVVDEAYPWNRMYEQDKFKQAVNYVGRADTVGWIADFFVDEFGNSGGYGFKEAAYDNLNDIETDWGHLGYAKPKNQERIIRKINEMRVEC